MQIQGKICVLASELHQKIDGNSLLFFEIHIQILSSKINLLNIFKNQIMEINDEVSWSAIFLRCWVLPW